MRSEKTTIGPVTLSLGGKLAFTEWEKLDAPGRYRRVHRASYGYHVADRAELRGAIARPDCSIFGILMVPCCYLQRVNLFDDLPQAQAKVSIRTWLLSLHRATNVARPTSRIEGKSVPRLNRFGIWVVGCMHEAVQMPNARRRAKRDSSVAQSLRTAVVGMFWKARFHRSHLRLARGQIGQQAYGLSCSIKFPSLRSVCPGRT
jgi:hypothetical protein